MTDDDQKQPAEELSEEEQKARHRLRMRFEWHDLIEDMIQEGQERGIFDNLRGKGKPLDLNKNPFEGEGELANTLLKEHDLLPAWLLKRNTIGAETEALRQDIRRTWQRYVTAVAAAAGDDGRFQALRRGWRIDCAVWQEEIARLNKAIADFNLARPSANLELFKLRLESELRRAGAPEELTQTQ
jgi:hypothetical protein